jgi:hypothetical protein
MQRIHCAFAMRLITGTFQLHPTLNEEKAMQVGRPGRFGAQNRHTLINVVSICGQAELQLTVAVARLVGKSRGF